MSEPVFEIVTEKEWLTKRALLYHDLPDVLDFLRTAENGTIVSIDRPADGGRLASDRKSRSAVMSAQRTWGLKLSSRTRGTKILLKKIGACGKDGRLL